MTDSNNNPQGSVDVAAIGDVLAGFGFTLQERTRLAFGRKVAESLKGVGESGYVIVLTQGITNVDAQKLTDIVASREDAAIVDARDTDGRKVRSHVKGYLKARKVKVATPPATTNEDGDVIAFLVRKSGK